MADVSDFLDEDDDLLKEGSEDSDLVKRLRRELKERNKALRTRTEELTKLQGEKRSGSLADLLKDAGAKPGLAKFFPKDREPTKDSVLEWLKEDGELFGYEPPEGGTDEPEDEEKQELRQGMEKVSNASGGKAGSAGRDLMTRIANASSRAELDKLYEELNAQQGVGSAQFQ